MKDAFMSRNMKPLPLLSIAAAIALSVSGCTMTNMTDSPSVSQLNLAEYQYHLQQLKGIGSAGGWSLLVCPSTTARCSQSDFIPTYLQHEHASSTIAFGDEYRVEYKSSEEYGELQTPTEAFKVKAIGSGVYSDNDSEYQYTVALTDEDALIIIFAYAAGSATAPIKFRLLEAWSPGDVEEFYFEIAQSASNAHAHVAILLNDFLALETVY